MRPSAIMVLLALAGAAAPAIAAEAAAPVATVKANRVVHAGEKITVRVPRSATHVGSERFDLYGVADAEVHVFVEPGAGKRMGKLYWVQFESYLPSHPDLAYNYADGNRRIDLDGTATWLRSGPVSTGRPMRPGSDREHVMGILKRAGYAIPPEVMNVRLVQILDDPEGTGRGRRELMVIYSEDLARTGKTLAELTTNGEPNAAWAPIEKALIQRATKAVSVERK